ncbi:hypothetical protein ABZ307_30720 [Streptomyces griseorubiginosus]|uniref:hypothetical protein n=1 Tax=Streptomyces griseorubiginosus TaxID=67304 RepID=UPI0033BEEF7B
MAAVSTDNTALPPEYGIPSFRPAYPSAPVVEIPSAGHFPAEDAPETLPALLELFVQTTPGART